MSSGATQKYLTRLEDSLDPHPLIEHLGKLHMAHKSKQAIRKGLNKLDKPSKDIMLNAEEKCRRLKSGKIPFSPEAGSGFSALRYSVLFSGTMADSFEIEAT